MKKKALNIAKVALLATIGTYGLTEQASAAGRRQRAEAAGKEWAPAKQLERHRHRSDRHQEVPPPKGQSSKVQPVRQSSKKGKPVAVAATGDPSSSDSGYYYSDSEEIKETQETVFSIAPGQTGKIEYSKAEAAVKAGQSLPQDQIEGLREAIHDALRNKAETTLVEITNIPGISKLGLYCPARTDKAKAKAKAAIKKVLTDYNAALPQGDAKKKAHAKANAFFWNTVAHPEQAPVAETIAKLGIFDILAKELWKYGEGHLGFPKKASS